MLSSNRNFWAEASRGPCRYWVLSVPLLAIVTIIQGHIIDRVSGSCVTYERNCAQSRDLTRRLSLTTRYCRGQNGK